MRIGALIIVGCLCSEMTGFGADTGSGVAVTNQTAMEVGDTVAAEYKKLLELDDEAQAEVDRWIRENQAFAAKGGGVPGAELNRRIRARFVPVSEAYKAFIQKHPSHTEARVAYASFLGDTGDEDGARAELENALVLDTKNPAIYNNLANIYGHTGPVKKAFDFYAKAIELNPNEPVYYHNFGTTVFLFRRDVEEHFGILEQQVFDKALELYSKAMKLDPTNFPLASDVAQTYYGIKPPRTEEALRSWTNAFRIANDDIEREGVHVHFARIKLGVGRFDEARAHLNAVTNEMYTDVKSRVLRNLNEKEQESKAPSDSSGSGK